jgi:hypothetical protein
MAEQPDNTTVLSVLFVIAAVSAVSLFYLS